jgi:hypothetical protein
MSRVTAQAFWQWWKPWTIPTEGSTLLTVLGMPFVYDDTLDDGEWAISFGGLQEPMERA